MATKRKNKTKETPVVFTSPESSNVEGGSYLPSDGHTVIGVRDKKNPEAKVIFYYYTDVSLGDWQALVDAPSKGKHMRNVFIKKYKGVKCG